MSRTLKGKKAIGVEINSKRPCRYIDFGKNAKNFTHRAERREAKKAEADS